MKANTALCFLFSGVAVLTASKPDSKTTLPLQTTLLAGVVVAIAGLSAAEMVLHCDWGIDQLLIVDHQTGSSDSPGRMSPATSAGFILMACALLAVDSSPQVSCALTLVGGLIPLIALVCYVYGVNALYEVSSFATMAVHTAFGFMLFALAVLTVRPKRGLVFLLQNPAARVTSIRPLLSGALLLPFFLEQFVSSDSGGDGFLANSRWRYS